MFNNEAQPQRIKSRPGISVKRLNYISPSTKQREHLDYWKGLDSHLQIESGFFAHLNFSD